MSPRSSHERSRDAPLASNNILSLLTSTPMDPPPLSDTPDVSRRLTAFLRIVEAAMDLFGEYGCNHADGTHSS